MKILVLNGSPKEKSDTMVLTNAFLRGINKSGNHEITVLNIIEKKNCTLPRLFWMLESKKQALFD